MASMENLASSAALAMAAPSDPGGGDFFAESSRVLGEMLESVSAASDPVRMYRELDAYRHLQKVQTEALLSGAAEERARFWEALRVRRAALAGGGPAAEGGDGEGGRASPSEEQVAEFRAHVRTWFQLDGELREMQRLARDKRAVKNRLRDVITEFMRGYNIDELRTQDGRLRFETRRVRRPPTRAAIHEGVQLLLKDNPRLSEEAEAKVFAAGSVETCSLKRLK